MFKDLYYDVIVKSMMDKFNYSNVMQIPRLSKICLNMGLGNAVTDSKIVDAALKELTLIAGQKAVITYAKNSVAGFKLRQGQAIGCKVTLRNNRMYEFFERLVYMALPGERDFKGVKKSQFDGSGNCAFGIREHIIFHEIDYDGIYRILGMDINIITSAKSDEEACSLLTSFGLPFYN